jgi:hypothetical protein
MATARNHFRRRQCDDGDPDSISNLESYRGWAQPAVAKRLRSAPWVPPPSSGSHLAGGSPLSDGHRSLDGPPLFRTVTIRIITHASQYNSASRYPWFTSRCSVDDSTTSSALSVAAISCRMDGRQQPSSVSLLAPSSAITLRHAFAHRFVAQRLLSISTGTIGSRMRMCVARADVRLTRQSFARSGIGNTSEPFRFAPRQRKSLLANRIACRVRP